MAATLSPRAISVSSMSKAYGLPGLRVGWAVCRDPQLAETLLAAKEQIVICGATLDEAIAGRVLRRSRRGSSRRSSTTCAPASAIVRDWMARPGHVRVDRAGGWRRRPRALRARASTSTPPASTSAARRARHLRRSRPLVRGRRPALPARLRLADRSELRAGLAALSSRTPARDSTLATPAPTWRSSRSRSPTPRRSPRRTRTRAACAAARCGGSLHLHVGVGDLERHADGEREYAKSP